MSLLIEIVVKYQSNFLYFLCKKNKTLMNNALESTDCWQNDQNINEHIDVLVVFQKK